MALFPFAALASFTDNPPAQPGFTHTSLNPSDTPPGKLLSGNRIGYSSPTIAEIDPNFRGKEIVVGGKDGTLYVYHRDGSLAWQVNVLAGLPTCNYNTDVDGIINSSPAVGDLFDNGIPYVVVGYGTILGPKSCPGGVAAYDGRNGSLRWRYQLTNSGENLHGVLSSPALADVDGDGTLEVGFGNFERDMVLLNTDGTKRWRYHNADTVWSSPAFADVDGDGLPDMIIGSDISENLKVTPKIYDGGYVTALRGTDSTILWRNYYNQVIWSSPVISDLDGDGAREVIVGAGCFDGFNPAVNGHWVKILRIDNGQEIRTLNASGCVASVPAVADLDGDSKLDIVVGVDGRHNSPATPGRVQAWSYDNPTPQWTATPGEAIGGGNDPDLGNLKSPVIADVDGNGSLEVLIANNSNIVIFNGATGAQLTCNNCNNGPQKTLMAWYPVHSTPAVGDLDGNGKLEVVAGGSHLYSPGGSGARGFLYVWTNITGLGSPAGSAPPNSAPWPMFHGGPTHTGVAITPALRPSATGISQIVQQGASARTVHISIADAADGAINWTATDNQSWISLGDSNGTTPVTLDVTINPSALALGTHTGKISLNSSFGDPEIDVTVRVVDEVFTVYMPLAQR
jgi:hypothetical protein